MAMLLASSWALPGCGPLCEPRRHHPQSHEQYGYRLALIAPPVTIVTTGPLTVNLLARRVQVDGEPVHLSGREWSVLAYLAEHIGEFCSSDDIVSAVWGASKLTRRRRLNSGRSGTYRVDHRALHVVLDRLRKRLRVARSLLSSVPMHDDSGYRLEMEPLP